jgi:DNA polymerase-3 subunit delta'
MPFNEVKGQNQVIFALSNAIQQNRLHHAYLFAGDDGVGKFKMAIQLAQYLLCTQPYPMSLDLSEKIGGCGVCSACHRVEKQIHPDFHCIQRELNTSQVLEKDIKIDKIREIQQMLGLTPFENGKRVIVIKEADRFNVTSANALLKVLEEPYPNTFFILISSRPKAILPTILSRCQVLRFSPLASELIYDLLEAIIAKQETETKSDTNRNEDLSFIARLSDGSIGVALALYERNIVEKSKEWLKLIENDLDLRDLPMKWSFSQKLSKFQEEEFKLWFKLIKTWYRDVLIVKQMKQAYDDLFSLVTFQSYRDLLFEKAKHLEFKQICWRIQALEAVELRLIEMQGINKDLLLDQLMLYLSGGDFRSNQEMIL